MSQTAEEKLVELAKAYARHRKALRENNQAIRGIDLKLYRKRYLSGEWMEPEEVLKWKGWLHAVDTIQAWDGKAIEDYEIDRSMARLLDYRKDIKAQGIRIRNRLRIIGDQLLRAEP